MPDVGALPALITHVSSEPIGDDHVQVLTNEFALNGHVTADDSQTTNGSAVNGHVTLSTDKPTNGLVTLIGNDSDSAESDLEEEYSDDSQLCPDFAPKFPESETGTGSSSGSEKAKSESDLSEEFDSQGRPEGARDDVTEPRSDWPAHESRDDDVIEKESDSPVDESRSSDVIEDRSDCPAVESETEMDSKESDPGPENSDPEIPEREELQPDQSALDRSEQKISTELVEEEASADSDMEDGDLDWIYRLMEKDMEDEEEVVEVPAPTTCYICDKDARYTCPKCSLRTCSLACCVQHKSDKACTARKNATRFKKLTDFDGFDYMDDMRLLFDTERLCEGSRRDFRRQTWQQHDQRKNLAQVVKFARQRDFALVMLPPYFEKHQLNASSYNMFLDTIFWTVNWSFPDAEHSFTAHRIPENVSISTLVRQTISPRNKTEEVQGLQVYREAGSENWVVLMPVEKNGWTRDTRYYELNQTDTIRTALKGKLVTDFPTLVVVLKSSMEQYPVLTAEMKLKKLQSKLWLRAGGVAEMTFDHLARETSESRFNAKPSSTNRNRSAPNRTNQSAGPNAAANRNGGPNAAANQNGAPHFPISKRRNIIKEGRIMKQLAKQSRRTAKAANNPFGRPGRRRDFDNPHRGRTTVDRSTPMPMGCGIPGSPRPPPPGRELKAYGQGFRDPNRGGNAHGGFGPPPGSPYPGPPRFMMNPTPRGRGGVGRRGRGSIGSLRGNHPREAFTHHNHPYPAGPPRPAFNDAAHFAGNENVNAGNQVGKSTVIAPTMKPMSLPALGCAGRCPPAAGQPQHVPESRKSKRLDFFNLDGDLSDLSDSD